MAPQLRRIFRGDPVAGKKFRYVFVVTYGRSGSTLVQGLLNALPRTLVRGENNFYILPLFRASALALTFKREHLKHGPRQSSSAFYGLQELNRARFAESAADLVTRNILGSMPARSYDVLGFKEVLWHRVQAGETGGFFAFLELAFPDLKYVLNSRDDHDRVIESGFWRSQTRSAAREAIERVEEIQEYLRSTRPERTLDVRYESLTSEDPATVAMQLRDIAEFVLGSWTPEVIEGMGKTLEVGHGPFPFGRSYHRPRTAH